MMVATTISHGRALLIGCLLVRLPEHEKEYSDAQRRKGIDQGWKQDDRGQKSPQDIHSAENQIPHQQGRDQNRSDEGQKRRSLERHDQSMTQSSVVHW